MRSGDKAWHLLAELDAVGNTTKAITKQIAIASAVIAATALFFSFVADARGLDARDASAGGRGRRLLGPLGEPLDLYRPQPDLWEFHIMDFWPDPGKYKLRLECVGKNKDSSGYSIGVNSIRLRERRPRVKAFGYDKDKDWRKQQVLYD